MKIATKWQDYSIIATGDGYKLERWGDVTLLRPDPQVIWPARIDMSTAFEVSNAFHGIISFGGSTLKQSLSLDTGWVN